MYSGQEQEEESGGVSEHTRFGEPLQCRRDFPIFAKTEDGNSGRCYKECPLRRPQDDVSEKKGIRRSAVRMRFIERASRPRPPTRCPLHRPGLGRQSSSRAADNQESRATRLGAAEIGPQSFGDVQLGIGDLPQQEIADTHFARGSDEEVKIRESGGVESRCDGLFVDVQASQTALKARVINDGVHGIHQLGAAAVVNGDVQAHTAIARCNFDGVVQLLADLAPGELIHAAHAGESNAVAQQIRKLTGAVKAQRSPKHVHFGARPLPVRVEDP